MRNEITWTAKNGKEIKVTVLSGWNCLVTLGGVEVARGELQSISRTAEIAACIGNVGMTRENYNRVADAAMRKIEAEKTPEQKEHDAEMEDYDRHCEVIRKAMAI